MMKSTDLWKGDDLALARRLYRARLRAILSEREVGPRLMIVLEIGRQKPLQVTFVQDDDVMEAIAPD
jgi:hypothetical protein